MNIKKAIVILSLAAAALFSTGCTTMATSAKIEKIKENVTSTGQRLLEEHRQINDVTYSDNDQPDIVGEPYTLFKGERLPDVFEAQYSIATSRTEELASIAQRITQLSGVPVIISDDVKDVKAFAFPFKGKLPYLLDILSSRANADWEYKDSAIHLFRYTTQVYYLHTLPGETQMSHELNAGADGQGSGKSEFKSKYDAKADIWDDISKTVESMLSKDGKAVTNESSGAIVVTDTSTIQRRVASYIESENSRLRRQVVLDVRLLMFTANESTEHGIDWNLLYQNSNVGVSLINASSSAPNAGSMSINILDGLFNGSSAVIKALDSIGETSLITSLPVTTISNQPANLVIADEQSYIAEVKSNLVQNAGATQEVTQKTVSTGVNMSVTPRVLTDRRLVLQLELNLTALLGFDETKVGGRDTSVVLKSPNSTRRSFMQRVLLDSGQTLVLTGFENNMGVLKKHGILGRDAWALGGQRQSDAKDAMLVLLVTPRIIGEGTL